MTDVKITMKLNGSSIVSKCLYQAENMTVIFHSFNVLRSKKKIYKKDNLVETKKELESWKKIRALYEENTFFGS